MKSHTWAVIIRCENMKYFKFIVVVVSVVVVVVVVVKVKVKLVTLCE